METVLVAFLAEFCIYLLFIGLVILWFIDGKIKKEQVVHALTASLIAWGISRLIKLIFPVSRPYLVDGRDAEVFFLPRDGSFPSEHTTIAFALAVTVFLHDRKVGWYFLVIALLIGAARVVANVHYPLDIMGGAFIGTFVAVLIEKTHFPNLFRRKY